MMHIAKKANNHLGLYLFFRIFSKLPQSCCNLLILLYNVMAIVKLKKKKYTINCYIGYISFSSTSKVITTGWLVMCISDADRL